MFLNNQEPLDLVQSDLCGYIRTPFLDPATYFMTLYDHTKATSLVRLFYTKAHTSWYLNKMTVKLKSKMTNLSRARRIRMYNVGRCVLKNHRCCFMGRDVMP